MPANTTERTTVPEGFALVLEPDPDPDFSWLGQDVFRYPDGPVTIDGQEIPPEDFCDPENHEVWLVRVIRLHDDATVDILGGVDLWHPTSPIRGFYTMGEECGYNEGEELPDDLAFLLHDLDFRSNMVTIRHGEHSDDPASLVCPHCEVPDEIEEWGTVIITHPIQLRDPGDLDRDPLVVTGPGNIEWEGGEDFQQYQCRACGEPVAIPEGWDREDES